MGVYIKTVFEEDSLMRAIRRAEVGFGGDVVLTISEETQECIESLKKMPCLPKIRMGASSAFLIQYCGRKVLIDNSLDFGEIKIYSEYKT